LLTIIYPYRNRDLQRLKNSFDSLAKQTFKNFEVHFVDYGSNNEMATGAKNLCEDYTFIKYTFHPMYFQPWNKSRALNSIIKTLETQYCFVADVDIIFHPQFVEKALNVSSPVKSIYFQVGFLDKDEKPENREFQSFKKYRKSTEGATGLALFPVKRLKEIRGFDEFFHFWGSEDTDVLERLRNAGDEVEFFNQEILLLHQWHISYRNSETKTLSMELQVEGIVQLNLQHFKHNLSLRKKIANENSWGQCIKLENITELEKIPVALIITNQKEPVNDLLYGQLPVIENKIFKVRIVKDPVQYLLKQRVKKWIGKKVPQYYSLKSINDKVLMHLISHYRDFPYHYKIKDDLQEIEFSVDFRKKD
jgi:glycosyltransferase involved in cell wall biosynthesis